jgi:type II secretory pathway pseudopilin PulG
MLDTLLLIVGGVGGVLLALWQAYRKGGRAQRQTTALEAAERAAKTRRRMDNAETGIGATDDAVLGRLRDHAR